MANPRSSHAPRPAAIAAPRSAAWLTAALVGLTAASGCKSQEAAAEDSKKEEEDLGPAIKVQLPPSPNFDEGKAPEKWEDGAWSIYGLRRDIDKNVGDGDKGTEIEVKGYVQDIYVPPECPEGEACPPPKQPHVWITDHVDTQGKKRAMMVVNYRFQIPEWDAKRWKDQPDVILDKGKRYTFRGKYKQFSDTGFSDARGLLEFVAYRPHDPETGQELATWVFPLGAPWHPVEIARQEEANAELVEKSKASAVQQLKGQQ